MKFKIDIKGDKADIYSPKNPYFTKRVKKIGGSTWTGNAWRIPTVAVDAARKFLIEEYGENDITFDRKIKVRMVAKDDVFGDDDFPLKVCAFGKILAEAYHRDSGAYVGEDVIMISGDIGSKGSAKYPCVYIKAGSEFIITNVPRSFFERLKEKEKRFDFEVIAENVDARAMLEAEKKALLNRICEIDKMLSSN